jgi:hypothetical protein
MREFDDAALEIRLRGVLKEHLGLLPLDITVADLERRREVRDAARRRRRGLFALGLAAALLVPIGVLVGGGRPRLEAVMVPPPSASPIASATPEASAGPTPVALVQGQTAAGPGRFRIDALVAGRAVDLTLPAGWRFDERNVDPWQFRNPGHGGWLVLQSPAFVYSDACGPEPVSTPVGPAITDIVEALTHLKGFTSSTVRDLAIDGHPAKAFSIAATSPACPYTMFPLWNGGYTSGGRSHRIWLVDVDGQPLLIAEMLWTADPPPDIDFIVASIAIGDR